jgi:catechol 2,3-dioxygenase-like lactoylglutathione lyase family enzyme
MAKIRHIAIFSDDTENLAKFYVNVFGMEIKGRSNSRGDGSNAAIWMTDGYMDIALLPRSSELAPEGLHHFGITLDPAEKEGVYERLRQADAWMMKPPPGRPYVEDACKDADGNKFDISTSQIKSDGKMVELKDQKRVDELVKA